MGCKTYNVNGVCIYPAGDDTACLCTFPHNNEHEQKIDIEQVKSMAYVGAMAALSFRGRVFNVGDRKCFPHDLPKWVKKEIDNKFKQIAEGE